MRLVIEGRTIDRIIVRGDQMSFAVNEPTQEQWDALMTLGFELTEKGVHTVPSVV